MNDKIQAAYNKKPKKWIYNLLIVLMIIGIFIFSIINSKMKIKQMDVLGSFKKMLYGFTHPDIELLFGYGKYKGEYGLPYLAMQTVAIAFIGTTIASILSLPFSFLASKKLLGKYSIIGEIIIILIRTFPEILLALILLKIVGLGSFTGVLVISIHSIGMISKLYAESIDNMDSETLEALDAVGSTKMSKIRHSVMPQQLPDFLSVALYRFDINIRTATILGVVSAGGLGYPIWVATSEWKWSQLSSIIIVTIVMVTIVDLISNWLRKKLV
ncbi:MAG: phosphonate ABC transporter, permease protein PhnE [Acholeplasmatales bacterium]|jgi:phosphonate transport system permease protein|nr:phosphonate ABC transporter, permease protein PhnE [Acholeplasmatales bacterium]